MNHPKHSTFNFKITKMGLSHNVSGMLNSPQIESNFLLPSATWHLSTTVSCWASPCDLDEAQQLVRTVLEIYPGGEARSKAPPNKCHSTNFTYLGKSPWARPRSDVKRRVRSATRMCNILSNPSTRTNKQAIDRVRNRDWKPRGWFPHRSDRVRCQIGRWYIDVDLSRVLAP